MFKLFGFALVGVLVLVSCQKISKNEDIRPADAKVPVDVVNDFGLLADVEGQPKANDYDVVLRWSTPEEIPVGSSWKVTRKGRELVHMVDRDSFSYRDLDVVAGESYHYVVELQGGHLPMHSEVKVRIPVDYELTEENRLSSFNITKVKRLFLPGPIGFLIGSNDLVIDVDEIVAHTQNSDSSSVIMSFRKNDFPRVVEDGGHWKIRARKLTGRLSLQMNGQIGRYTTGKPPEVYIEIKELDQDNIKFTDLPHRYCFKLANKEEGTCGLFNY